MPKCPVENDDGEVCGSRHDTEAGVVQHIFASKGEGHEQYDNKGDIWVLVRSGEGDASSDSTHEDNNSGDNPLKQGPEADTDAGETETCPACGETGDVSGLSDGDRIRCEECGEELIYNE